MKILVPIKQVADPDQYGKLRILDDGSAIDDSALDRCNNPFDEYALEAALRLTENGKAPKTRLGEITAVTFGHVASEAALRSALALGATTAIRVETSDSNLDPHLVAHGLARLVRNRGFDVVLMGKQSVDGDGQEVPQRVAALLDWPQVTCVSSIEELEAGVLFVRRELDRGIARVRVRLPCVVSVDLRVILPEAVRSRHTAREFAYPSGVRYASLPAILASKRKPIELAELDALVEGAVPKLAYQSPSIATQRRVCEMVNSVPELVQQLQARGLRTT